MTPSIAQHAMNGKPYHTASAKYQYWSVSRIIC
jgi:hypothetical protein